MENPHEKRLEEAGEALGQVMARVSPQEKEILRGMKREVDQFAEDEMKKGKEWDRSAVFALGIIAHPDVKDEALILAARDYIDTDYQFVKSLRNVAP